MSTTTRTPIRLGALEVTFLLDEHDTHGQATTFETLVPAGAKVPLAHSHDEFEEVVFGLEGVFTFTVDGGTHAVGPGDALFIARGVVHHFENQGDVDGRFLSVATPGVFRPAYFEEIRDVLTAAAGGPPDVQALVDVMRRHGLTPVAG